MVKKILKYAKFVVCCALIVSLVAPSYAALSASDGSAFVTKAEFDAALADFNSRLTTFEAGINSKIDSQVTSYLDRNGIWNGKEQERLWGHGSELKFLQMGSHGVIPLIKEINKSGLLYLQVHGIAFPTEETYFLGTAQYRNMAFYELKDQSYWNHFLKGTTSRIPFANNQKTNLVLSSSGSISFQTSNLSSFYYCQCDWDGSDSSTYRRLGAFGSTGTTLDNDIIETSQDGRAWSTGYNYISCLDDLNLLNPASPDYAVVSSYISKTPVGMCDINTPNTTAPIENSQFQLNIFMFVTKGGLICCQVGYGLYFCFAPDTLVGTNARTRGYKNGAVVY